MGNPAPSQNGLRVAMSFTQRWNLHIVCRNARPASGEAAKHFPARILSYASKRVVHTGEHVSVWTKRNDVQKCLPNRFGHMRRVPAFHPLQLSNQQIFPHLVSAVNSRRIQPHVESSGLASVFNAVVWSRDASPKKPLSLLTAVTGSFLMVGTCSRSKRF